MEFIKMKLSFFAKRREVNTQFEIHGGVKKQVWSISSNLEFNSKLNLKLL